MKSKQCVIGFLIFIFFFISIISNAEETTESMAKITFFQGKVSVKQDTSWTDVELNMPLYQGDSLKTFEDSRIEIKFSDKGLIRLDEHSILCITELSESEKGFVSKSKVLLGKIWSHVKSLSKETDEFETSSPAAVAAVRGTVYRCDVNQDKSTNVYVYEGNVSVKPWRMPTPQKGKLPWGDLKEVEGPEEISMEEWTVLVKELQRVHVIPDGEKPEVEDFDETEDEENEWVQWNKNRDEEEFGE